MDKVSINQFIEVTGESEATATQYLSLTGGDVESAISLLFETGGNGASTEAPPPPPEEADVRPPILPTREILVPDEPVCSFSRTSSNVFDRFRDFSVEMRRQEEEMTRRVSGNNQATQSRSRRLEDLFRPPYEILFMGSFVEAREQAKSMNRWLLVNVQNPLEFSCQTLNRDVWPNGQIKEIVKDHFVLWQVLSNSTDGKRYIDFYNVMQYPYLSIIDPRTGECMKTLVGNITVDRLLTSLNDMLSTYPSPECSTSSPKIEESHCEPSSSINRPDSRYPDREPERRSKRVRNSDVPLLDEGSGTSRKIGTNSNVGIRGKRSRMVMETPEIEKIRRDTGSAEPTVQKPTASASSSTITSPVTTDRSPSNDQDGQPTLKLCLRLPDGGKETFSICANDTIATFIERMELMGFRSSEYTYLIPFPKTNVGELPSNTRLSETILYPSNTVFITKI